MSLASRLTSLATAVATEIKAVKLRTLDQIPVAAANVNMGLNRVTNVGSGLSANDAVNVNQLSAKGDMFLGTTQTVTGVKTFNDNTLLMKSADGTIIAEPYSDANPPETLVFTEFPSGSVGTVAAGTGQVFTSDSKTLWMKGDDAVVRPIDMSWENCPFNQSGTLTVKVGTGRYPVKGGTFQIQTIAVIVNTAPTGAAVIVDVNKNGVTLYATQANRPTIAAGTFIATVGAHTATTVTDNDYLSIDIDQIGSTIAGSDLTVVVRMQRIA